MIDPSGLLLLDKPPGPTSHDMVRHIRKVAGIRRVGHAGTLDPFASGLLLLLLGSATRLAEYLIGMEKGYEAIVRLGVETTSGDPEGEVVTEDGSWEDLGPGDVEAGLHDLRGRILQVPPVYSAKKVGGEAAHRRTRRGEEVVLEPVEVEVYELTVLEEHLPFLRLSVRCSSGTYVRALARDLGRHLGVGAYLSALRRVSVGPFSVASSLPPNGLQSSDDVRARLLPGAEALSVYPAVELTSEEAARVTRGQFLPVRWESLPEGTPVRMLRGGVLLGVAHRQSDLLKPRKVLSNG